jgi:polar amino acid transport system substrate-binding protein
MCNELRIKTGGQPDVFTSPLTSTEMETTELPPMNMEQVAVNFRRMTIRKEAAKTRAIESGQAGRPAEGNIHKLFGLALIMGLGVSGLPSVATARAPLVCGSHYAIKSGDTLFKVAKRAYGNGKLYKKIYQANSDILPSPSSVEIGNEILIPCLDDAGQIVRKDAMAEGLPATISIPEVPEAAQETLTRPPGLLTAAKQLVAAATMPIQSFAGPVMLGASTASPRIDETTLTPPAPSGAKASLGRVNLLTGVGFAPASQNLPQGNMITDLIARSLHVSAPERRHRVTVVSDWAAHLDYLLPEGTFDVSFPWYKPDCTASDRLNAEMQKRCAEFDFSNPIFEVRFGFYTRAGDVLAAAETVAGLAGKRLCRPNGHINGGLDQNDLMASIVSIETQYTAQQCFDLLIAGQVDVVALAKSEAVVLFQKHGQAYAVTEIAGLETARSLHALVPKKSQNGQTVLELINRGLAQVMVSGEWFTIVASHQGQKLAQMN